MEEDDIGLIDYLRVIWKRKILIIVGTLVCIVAGVTVSLRLPEIYHAEALMRIGKTVNTRFVSSSYYSPPPPFVLLDTVESLVKTIPIEYGLNEETDLSLEVVKGTSLIEIVLKGPDEGKTRELLEEVVEKLIAYHLGRTESTLRNYEVLIGKLETDIGEIQNNLNQEALALKEISIDMDKEISIDMDVDKLDPLTFMVLQAKKTEIQNKTIAKLNMKQIAQNNLKQSSINIRSIRDDIFLHQLTINTLKNNKTKLIGEVVEICVKPKKIRNIMLAGVVGLTMSLFLAFCMAYLGNVRERGEGEGEGEG